MAQKSIEIPGSALTKSGSIAQLEDVSHKSSALIENSKQLVRTASEGHFKEDVTSNENNNCRIPAFLGEIKEEKIGRTRTYNNLYKKKSTISVQVVTA